MKTGADHSVTVVEEWTGLDLANHGRICIEASAGTGKTWTIAALYLRLVLERGLLPRQIVVTTFTEPAAQELRERLRGALLLAEHEASVAASNKAGEAASYEAWLCARWHGNDGQRADDLRKLRLALSQLDIAPVGTLHGLCRRILADHPFASGIEFVLPELVAGETVLDEVVNDLWRIVRQGADDDAFVKTLVASGVVGDIEELRQALKLLLAPGVTVATATPSSSISDADVWGKRLRTLSRTVLKKNSALEGAWLRLADRLEDPAATAVADELKGLRMAADDETFLKRKLGEPFLDEARKLTCELIPAIEALRLAGLAALADLARARMRATLARRNQMRFDDLLLRVKEALDGETDGTVHRLADALFGAWPVALIDEFQDTDAVQFGILDAVYRDARHGQRGLLVMIGDPKQAIYRFRGGDIDAYREAVAQARQHLTLRVNRRSSRALVAAVNEFYAAGGTHLSAFTDKPAVGYITVDASDRCEARPYTIGGQAARKPLVIHYSADQAATVGPRRTAALTQCADQIVQMLQSDEHRIGDRMITPADIAVLVPTSKNIIELRDLLRARRVPCATTDQTSVFHTDIARELQVVLYAVANAGDLGALRAAAATRLWNASFADLQRYGDDLAQWQPVSSRFHAWHGVWSERGVLAVIEQLLDHMATRYLATPAGARAITDLRHLGELLQAEDDVVSGKEELLSWLTRQRSDDGDDSSVAVDVAQLRIESDGGRVRIMTLHLSKGLEFPIVFLPLMWDHTQHFMQDRNKIYMVHADGGGRQLAVSDVARDEELRDLQDERFRVLYVALTRAIHACHVYALPPDARKKGTERSPFDEMVQRMTPPLVVPGQAGASTALEHATPHIDWMAGWLQEAMQIYRPGAANDLPVRSARKLPHLPARAFEAKHSFTTLTQFAHAGFDTDAAAADEIDIDRSVAIDTDDDDVVSGASVTDVASSAGLAPHPELARLARVRGADFGNAIHAVFERRVVGEPLALQGDLVARCLDEARVRRRDVGAEALVAAVTARLDGALAAPLGLAHAAQLRLADVAARDQRAEMEFHFAIDGVAMNCLREVCARHGEPELVPRSHSELRGLMTGKIDLIFRHGQRFHVLDYKGNHLGDDLSQYSGHALRAVMDANHYRFQALIYTIATDRYLRQRLGGDYDRSAHLGECVYLFVRAAGLSADAGIWRHRFSDELLEAVDGVFAGSLEEAA